MSKGHRAKIWFEQSCRKHGKKNKSTGTKVINGDPANHDRGLKRSGCPVCKAEEKKNS